MWQSVSASDMRTSHMSRVTLTHPLTPIPRISTPGESSPIFWRPNPRGAVNVVPPFNNQRNIFLTPLSLMSSRHHWVAIMYPLVTEEQTLVLFFSSVFALIRYLPANVCQNISSKYFSSSQVYFHKIFGSRFVFIFPRNILNARSNTPQAYLLRIINFLQWCI